MSADTDESTLGDECLSERHVAGSDVDGADKAGVGVDIWNESAGDVCGMMKDADPEFWRERGETNAAFGMRRVHAVTQMITVAVHNIWTCQGLTVL